MHAFIRMFAVLTMLAIQVVAAAAQQNPLVGTWSTSTVVPRGAMTAYVDFYPNGALHMSGVVTGGGQPIHEWGTYRIDPTRSILQYVFHSYGPQHCAMGICEPPPFNINHPVTVGYQFPNAYQVYFSDGSAYTRQRFNPFPDPNR
jgi:hypothetical protein